MDEIKKFIHTLAILSWCATLVSCDSNLTVQNFQRNIISYGDTYIGFPDNNNSFIYANCPQEYGDYNVTCEITVETPVSEPFNFTKKTCYALLSNWNQYRQTPRLVPVNEKYILLIHIHDWRIYNSENSRYETVKNDHVEVKETTIYTIRVTDCHVVKNSLPNVEIENTEEIVYRENEDFFYVFYMVKKNLPSSNIDCKLNICRVRYSLDGKLIDEPKEYQMRFEVNRQYCKLIPLWSTLTSDFTYYSFYTGYFGGNSVYRIHNGIAKEVLSTNIFVSSELSDVSVSNDKVSFCMISRKNEVTPKYAVCQQYDSKGQLLMNFTLSPTYDTFDRVDLYNLRDGGLVLATTSWFLNDGPKIYHVRSDGTYTLMEINRDKSTKVKVKFLENDMDLCVKFISYPKNERFGKTVYTITCISKNNYKYN